jgi:hypothetical protein
VSLPNRHAAISLVCELDGSFLGHNKHPGHEVRLARKHPWLCGHPVPGRLFDGGTLQIRDSQDVRPSLRSILRMDKSDGAFGRAETHMCMGA